VREDAHKLFGFLSGEEREIFRLLIGISQIGPKVAMNVLSGVSAGELVQCVNRGDPLRLQKIPGVGAKTAQRLVMELKGKLGAAAALRPGADDAVPRTTSAGAAAGGAGNVRDEVYAAMIALGYNEKQVVRALERAGADMKENETVEVWIRKVLQVI
jgi:Holliday junction DNA helicase RuvA